MPVSARSSAIRRACPGVATPMEEADGFLVRLRLPGGTIDPSEMRSVAEVADRFGNGVVELTSRANLQIRGLHATALEPVAARLAGIGSGGSGHPGESLHDVVAAPLTGHDPDELIDLGRLISQAAGQLSGPGRSGLPPKFGTVLDAGGSAPVRRVAADICFGAVRSRSGRVMMQMELGRALDEAGPTIACIPPSEVPPVLAAGARLCATEQARMGPLVDRDSRAALVAVLTEGIDLHREPAPVPSRRAAAAPLGVTAHRDPGRVNVGAAPLLGRPTPGMLRSLADLTTAASALLRLTPWRGVVLLGVDEEWAERIVDGLTHAGFSADPADPAHLVSACAGRPGCASARADTLGAARALVGGPSAITSPVHFSGCEKRCGVGAGVGAGAGVGDLWVADELGSFRRAR